MRVITSLQGSVAVIASPDEATAKAAVLTRDLVAFIGRRYRFSLIPEVPPGLIPPQLNAFTFQVGELVLNERKIPINQLTWTSGAAIITAKDTNNADLIANDMIAEIDEEFGTQISTSVRRRIYLSILIVDFSPGLEQQISALLRAQSVINKHIAADKEFVFWRLGFGVGAQQQGQTTGVFSVDDLAKLDFTIERRGGEPPALNRYHCAAPLSTSEHERVLGLVEEALRDPS